MTDDPALLPATEMVARYRAGSLSPVTVTEACLARIEALNPILNAFCRVDAEGALAAAGESAARWAAGAPLEAGAAIVDGVPTSVKDLVLTRGWPTLRGSRAIDPGQPWDEDAPAVARLRAAGAVLVGKTTTPELGWKGVTDSPLTGITRNPWDPDRTPGGSSGGAAVAAATGMAALNIGTDGGGSIRIPASFTGIVGIKPSYGRVPAYPPSPFGSLSHLGPMTRTVGDAALMLQVLAQPDSRDPAALPCPPEDFAAGLEGGIGGGMNGLRIGYAETLDGYVVEPGIARLVADAVGVFADLGAAIEPVAPPLAGASDIFARHWTVGAATVLEGFPEAARAVMDPGLVAAAGLGRNTPLIDYAQAMQARARMGLAMNLFHRDYDLLLMPTEPIAAFAAGRDTPADGPYRDWPDWTPFTYPFNLTQQPAISVPCGLTAEGFPAGLQIVGPLHADAAVLRAARAFETARPWPLPPCAADPEILDPVTPDRR
ncbi:MAG: amidase [Inquilinus sp.]|nr:amidase [Inquilinus sp.]